MKPFLFLIIGALLCLILASAQAEQANVLGMRVVDVDGNAHHLGSGFDAKPISITFLNTHCPIARKYIPNLNELSELATQHGVGFYGVVSDPDVIFGQVKAFQQDFSISFPLIFDSTGDLSKRLQPKITPEAFVINREDVIAYRGRIDNRFVSLGKQRTNITEHDLRDAMIAVANQQAPKSNYEKPVGCIAPKWDNAKNTTSEITYSKHIAPILNANCVECHRPGEVAPFSLLTYEEAKRWAAMIKHVTQERIMPPWKPVKGFGDFRDERVLSDHQIQFTFTVGRCRRT